MKSKTSVSTTTLGKYQKKIVIGVDSFGSKLIPFNLYVLGLQYSQLASS